MNDPAISILIPAHDEAAYLPGCLQALLESDDPAGLNTEVIVVANGCTDDTAAVARAHQATFAEKGWPLTVLDLRQGSKLNALNAGEDVARGRILVYLDADVLVSPALLAELAEALDVATPRYASGRAEVTTAGSRMSAAYTRFWLTTPFLTEGVPGFGLFAMNRAGRDRWQDWPHIISDDTFARLHFSPEERIAVPADYRWPMIEGFGPLVRVRRRQDYGVTEIAERYPQLLRNEDAGGGGVPVWRRALRDPVAFAAFVAVRLTVHLPFFRSADPWARGR